jgi:hypothetical protein
MKGAGTIKSVLPKLNRETSSFTVVDGQDWNSTNFFTGIQNFVKNRTVLNQTEGIFANFKRETFGQDAILIYNEVKRAHELKNKFTLMQYVSFPIYEVFFCSQKTQALLYQQKDPKLCLPFQWHKPRSSKLLQGNFSRFKTPQLTFNPARIFSHDTHGFNKTFTWHQMAMEFQMEDKAGTISHRMNVFERREIEGMDGTWRLCYIG